MGLVEFHPISFVSLDAKQRPDNNHLWQDPSTGPRRGSLWQHS
jgi:hypothetical protein